MKKIFTLIAVAAAALSANAQTETLVFAQDATYSDNQVLTTTNTSLTLGNDQKNNDGSWTLKVAGSKEYLADLSQEGTYTNGEGESVDGSYYVNIAGGNNPKDQSGKNAGSGFNAAEGKTLGNLPQSGTYYIIETQQAGRVKAGVILNASKEFYVVDATDAAIDETETYLQVTLPDANIKDYTLIGPDGALDLTDESLLDTDNMQKGGVALAEKLTGFVQFYAAAGHKYYIFCTGSKLGFFGYTFEVGLEPDGINTVATSQQEGKVFNLAGQQVQQGYKGLVIKNGKKVVLK